MVFLARIRHPVSEKVKVASKFDRANQRYNSVGRKCFDLNSALAKKRKPRM